MIQESEIPTTGDARAQNPSADFLPVLHQDRQSTDDEKRTPLTIVRIKANVALDGGKNSSVRLRGRALSIWVERGARASSESEVYTEDGQQADVSSVTYSFSTDPEPKSDQYVSLLTGPRDWHFPDEKTRPKVIRFISTGSLGTNANICVAVGDYLPVRTPQVDGPFGPMRQLGTISAPLGSNYGVYVKNLPVVYGGKHSLPSTQPGALGTTEISLITHGIVVAEYRAQTVDANLYVPGLFQVAEVVEVVGRYNTAVPTAGTIQLQGRLTSNDYINIGAAVNLAAFTAAFTRLIRSTKESYVGYRVVIAGAAMGVGGDIDLILIVGLQT